MKRLITSLLFLCLLFACQKEDASSIKISEQSISYSAIGGRQSVSINFVNVSSWSIATQNDFLSVSPDKGSEASVSVTIRCKSYKVEDTREGTITIRATLKSGKTISQDIKVTQKGQYALETLQSQTIVSQKIKWGSQHSVPYSIILPPDWKDSGKKYPIIYLLHGYGDNEVTGWVTQGNAAALTEKAIKNKKIGEVIVVMPNAYETFYQNGWEYQYETFFFEEFMPYIEKTYPVSGQRNERMVAGLSMGGFGTLHYATTHPELFCFAYSMSPAIWDSLNNDAQIGANAPQKPKIVIACGTSDSTVYTSNPEAFTNYLNLLKSLNYDAEMLLEPGYGHLWNYWQLCYGRVLEQFGQILK